MSHVDAVQAAQPRRFGHEPVHAAGIGAGQPIIGFDARFYCRAGRLRLQEVRIETFQRIVPVVISGNCIDRLGEALEGQIEVAFVILDGPCRIDDVGGYDKELHVIAASKVQIARDQRILRRIAFPRIADDKKAEITRAFYAAGVETKQDHRNRRHRCGRPHRSW